MEEISEQTNQTNKIEAFGTQGSIINTNKQPSCSYLCLHYGKNCFTSLIYHCKFIQLSRTAVDF